jgi:hypothetical protein
MRFSATFDRVTLNVERVWRNRNCIGKNPVFEKIGFKRMDPIELSYDELE